MSATGLEVFDETLQKTSIWLKEIEQAIGPDRHRAYHALRAVLHCLRDRLTVNEAAQLADQFPMLIRGIYYEAWLRPESRRSSGRVKSSSPSSVATSRKQEPSIPRMRHARYSRSSRIMSLQARSEM
jgi:uncharacterized protein (DUF2267 family)